MPAHYADVHFVALPGQLEAAGFPAAEHWKIYLVTMVISFISVVPFIIYAEVKRKMKRVFLLCVAILLIAEIVLWGAGGYFWELVAGVQLFFWRLTCWKRCCRR